MVTKRQITINLDFDGTCLAHDFPRIGKDIGSVPVLKRLVENGHNLILFTMRSDMDNKGLSDDPSMPAINGKFLTDAINWFKDNDIPLYGIQTNPTQHTWTSSPKSYAELMLDDTAVGCPLIYDITISERPFVDWVKMECILENMGLI